MRKNIRKAGSKKEMMEKFGRIKKSEWVNKGGM